ncbi:MAG: energy transducer TonB [Thermodesulfovibrionia bacterium]|nr:energy transducer TonB [Thermodesulfovibrionia bacterium]
MKKTIALSLFFHIFLFIAALLLSAHLPGGSRKGTHEKVFFVNLEVGNDIYREDTGKSESKKTAIKLQKPELKKLPLMKVKKKPVPDIQDKNLTVKTKTFVFKRDKLSGIQKDFENGILLASTKIDQDNVINIPSNGKETSAHNSYNLPSPGRGLTGGKGSGILTAGIIEIIRGNIERVKSYPVLARKRGIEGTVYISFSIGQEGEPQGLKILKGSGSRILDNATVEIVKRAAPFPHVENPVEVPVVFKLD